MSCSVPLYTPSCSACFRFATLMKVRVGTGWMYGWWCCKCDRICGTKTWVRRFDLIKAGIDVDTIPERVTQNREPIGPVELHHYAPKEVFGVEDAERHPVGALCRPCHERWHEKMGAPIGRR